MTEATPAARQVVVTAPTRVCDVGGWTDTAFARHGAVCNVAVEPLAEVRIRSVPREGAEAPVLLSVENYGETYPLDPTRIVYDRHPLLEAAIRTLGVPGGWTYHVTVSSEAPPGASLGTSAAVAVALVGALDALAGGGRSAHEVATIAHRIETGELGLQCGVQDQLASAHGGVNLIEIGPFPRAEVTPIIVPPDVLRDFERRLLVVYVGRPHRSSEVHERVIAGLGPEAHRDPRIEALRGLAREAAVALGEGDLRRLGEVFDRNTDLQRALHPGLVSQDFERIIALADAFGCLGSKVNGAGGDGGSVALLTDGDAARRLALAGALEREGFRILPVRLSPHGLRIRRTRAPDQKT